MIRHIALQRRSTCNFQLIGRGSFDSELLNWSIFGEIMQKTSVAFFSVAAVGSRVRTGAGDRGTIVVMLCRQMVTIVQI